MSTFDRDAAERARKENPALSIFDTGEALEPFVRIEDVWYPKPGAPSVQLHDKRKTGTVEFDDTEGATILTVCAYPSSEDDDTILLEIDAPLFSRLKIVVNDGDLAAIDRDGTATFLTREVRDAMERAQRGLDAGDGESALIDLLRLLEGND